MTCYNFAAGPAVLPVEVIAQIKQDLPDYAHSGMSVMEISHRSALYKDLYAETKANLLGLMKLDPAEYDVLFLSGGATQQFSTIPLNLAHKYHRIRGRRQWSLGAKSSRRRGQSARPNR
ncbi:aminotransferase class V-fold PLP-dependent enzyme [Lactobacillus delbrueckii subsp. bulgaricus]